MKKKVVVPACKARVGINPVIYCCNAHFVSASILHRDACTGHTKRHGKDKLNVTTTFKDRIVTLKKKNYTSFEIREV